MKSGTVYVSFKRLECFYAQKCLSNDGMGGINKVRP